MFKKIISLFLIFFTLNIFIFSSFPRYMETFSSTVSAGIFSKSAKLIVGGLIIKAITSNSARIAKYATKKVLTYLERNPHKTEDVVSFIGKYTKNKSSSIRKKGKILISKIHKHMGWKKVRYQKFPKNGRWVGEKGNSKFVIERDSRGISLKDILIKYKIDKLVVRFKNGYPIFPKKFIKNEFNIKRNDRET